MKKYLFFPGSLVTITIVPPQITYTCFNETLNLHANLSTGQTTGVTWTQLTGAPITITNPTSTTPSITFPSNYQNTSTGSITLRISLTSNPTIYQDLLIITQIGSILPSSINRADITGSNYISNDLVVANIAAVVPLPSTASGSTIYNTSTDSTINITFTIPTVPNMQVYEVDVQADVAGLNTTIATLTSGFNYPVLNIPNRSNYRTVGYYKDAMGNTQVKAGPITYVQGKSNLGSFWDTLPTSGVNGFNTYTNALYTFTVLDQHILASEDLPSSVEDGLNTYSLSAYQFLGPKQYITANETMPGSSIAGPLNTYTNTTYQFTSGGYTVG